MYRSTVFYIPLFSALAAALLCSAAGCQTNAANVAPSGDMVSEPETAMVETFFKDGTVRIREYVTYSDDGAKINDGLYTRWYPNTAKECEMTFAHGVKHGTAIFWHRNGEKWTQDHYVRGVKQGSRLTWDDSGRKRMEEQYLDGKPHGTWTVWRDNGEIKSRAYFDHGKPADQAPKDRLK
jgi:antitoxin component YwqK of YwqJK toxin-antitoxin module